MDQSIPLAPICHVNFSVLKDYLARKWPVIPLHSIANGYCTCAKIPCERSGKHPRTFNGLKDASLDPLQVTKWWQRWPNANVGILTGSTSGLVVLDIDKKDMGYESLEQLEAEIGKLPASFRVLSGGGGLHIYFQCLEMKIKSRVKLRPGIDIRGEGAYIVAPPSNHISGEIYSVSSNEDLAELPKQLLAILSSNGLDRVREPHTDGIPEGKRNDTLVSIGGFLRNKGLSKEQIAESLHAINQTACLPPACREELERILKSIESYRTLPWEMPIDLSTEVIKTAEMSLDLLPRSIQSWCSDCSDRMQVPLEFIAAPMIVAAASVIGRKMGIRPLRNDTWTVIPNLWGFVVADPGSLKSPAISEAMKPLEELASNSTLQYQTGCQQAQKRFREIQVEIESLRQSLKIDLSGGFMTDLAQQKRQLCTLENEAETVKAVKEKRYKTNDPTVEKLAMILKENPQGILLLRDELSGWLDGLHKSGREGSREFYLEAWNGNSSYSIDRIGRGTMHVEALCLSIFGGIQPAKLEEYIERHSTAAGDDGFLERFQVVVFPEMSSNWRLIDRAPNLEGLAATKKAFLGLDEIPFGECGTESISFTSEAQEIADRWRCNLERRIRNEDSTPILRSHLSKYRSLMPSLALIFTLLEEGCGAHDVGIASLKRAIRWCEILETHIRKVYHSTLHNPHRGAQSFAKKIRAGLVNDGDKIRDILRKNWAGLKTVECLDPALTRLTELNWVRVEKTKTTGGISERLRINPALLSSGGVS